MIAGLLAESAHSSSSGLPPIRGAVLQRKCACGASNGLTRSCTDCEKKKLLGKPLQAKLRVNEPDDDYEQEADRVAQDVMRTPDARAGRGGAETASRSPVPRRVAGGDSGQGEVPAIVNEVLLSPGGALDGPTRAFFEARLGYDFGKVRIHADAKSAQSASDLNAHAYTVGNNVVFGAGRFQPATFQGRSLLAHELTHVVQQASAGGAAGALQRSPVFPDESCDKERVKDKITAAVEQSLGMVQQAIAALAEPVGLARPLKRFFSIEPDDPVALFLIKENLGKFERKLAGAVDSYCQTPADYRSENHKAPPRGYADLDPKTRRPTPDSPITYNRNIFRLTGTTTHRQVVNTVLHEYAHLAGIGHAEPVQGAPIGDENSTKVRGLTTEQAINSAETMMRFVRAVSAREDSGSVIKAASAKSARDQHGHAEESRAAGDTGDAFNCDSLNELMAPRFPKAEIEERPTLEAHYPGLKGNCFRLLRGGDDSCFGYCLHRAAGGDPLGKGVNLPIPATIEEFESAFASYYTPIQLEAVDAANPPADAVLALFARGDTPAHTACRSDIQYEGQYLWESKVSPVYPLILHHLSDLEGGAAGAVVKLYKPRAVEQP